MVDPLIFSLDGAEAKIKAVRILVEPPPSSHCPSCGGMLLFKLHRSAKFTFDSDSEIFICEECGKEHRYTVRPSFRISANSRLDTA
jgi:RNase P subunit RPR2